MEQYQKQYETYRGEVEACLRGLLAGGQPYSRLQEAMRYSLLAGGKRVRPILTLAFCEQLGGDRQKALPLGCALELVHTYSLIHDDLPCMDDDDLRRGRPTCHRAYGEAMAVLAGDALQAEAFRLIAAAPGLTAQQSLEAVRILADACGGDGMVAGQVLDMEQAETDETGLRRLCGLKTGAMIQAAAELGCVAADAPPQARRMAADYGAHIGLAFQIRDDMLDVTASEAEFGKPTGSDQRGNKRTFASLLGLAACERLVAEETRLAKDALVAFPNGGFLHELADRLADRLA